MSITDKDKKEEEKLPTSEEAEIVSEHQSRIILQDGLLGRLSDLISNSGCMDCNRKLEWELLSDDNNKNLVTGYTAKHCRRLYSIQLETTGVRVIMLGDEEARKLVKEQKVKTNEAKIKKESEEKQQKDKELAEEKKLKEEKESADKKLSEESKKAEDKKLAESKKQVEAKKESDRKLAEESQNKKDLAEIQKQGLNTDKEGRQGDIFKAQQDAQTVSIHAEDPNTRRQAGTIADRLDQQTT